MRPRGAITAVTVLLAAAATALVYLYLQTAGASDDPAAAEVSVVVSTEDIPANTDLDGMLDEAFTTRVIPRDVLLEGAIRDLGQLRGQRTAYPIVAGEQILVGRLKGSAALAGGTLGITPDHVAITIRLGDQQGGAGTISTGDQVTVYGTFQDTKVIAGDLRQLFSPSSTPPPQRDVGDFTVTLVPTVRVLRVQSVDSGVAEGGEVLLTLDLTKRDAQDVVFAQENGRVWVGLLPPGEEGRWMRGSSFPFQALVGKGSA